MANTQRKATSAKQPARRRKKKNPNAYLYIGVGLFLVSIILIATIIFLTVGCNDESIDESSAESSQAVSEPSEEESSAAPLQTGWVIKDGKSYYYNQNGDALTGVNTLDGSIYVFASDGSMSVGWATVDGATYYLGNDGKAQIGWATIEGNKYYLKPDGKMAIGKVEIDGKNEFFSESGIWFALANPWNEVEVTDTSLLVKLPAAYGHATKGLVHKDCYDDLMAMMDDCYRETKKDVYVISGHRTYDYQANNYKRQVNQFLNQGYSQADAERMAAEWVAVPGTSEHHLGFAVDIIDTEIWDLVEEQETLEGQQWLMENCWKYGFILRYPKGKKNETGINYEPWHYRYLGKEIAKEVHDSGLTLEAYIEKIS